MTIIFCVRSNTHRFLQLELGSRGIVAAACALVVAGAAVSFASGRVAASILQQHEGRVGPTSTELKLAAIKDRFERVWHVDRVNAKQLTKRIGTLNGRMKTFIAKAETLAESARAYRDPAMDSGFETLDWVFEPLPQAHDDTEPYRLPVIFVAPRDTS